VFFEAYRRIQSLQDFHELAHHDALIGVTTDVLGEEVLCHPRKIFRVSPAEDPRFVTPPHQDFRLIQGTVDVLTGWIPLGDCPEELGGLKVLDGSHHGLRAARVVNATGAVACPADDDDPCWASTEFTDGDLLLFHSFTVHGAKPNLTDRLRMSVDFRYQARSQPVVDGSLGSHYAPVIPDYSVLTQGWSSTWSVDSPDGLHVVEIADPFADEMEFAPSRLAVATA
jgi:ectoine hydroxylase-related dioxygenase (phytanoyl-CoA dioxygenase family)